MTPMEKAVAWLVENEMLVKFYKDAGGNPKVQVANKVGNMTTANNIIDAALRFQEGRATEVVPNSLADERLKAAGKRSNLLG